MFLPSCHHLNTRSADSQATATAAEGGEASAPPTDAHLPCPSPRGGGKRAGRRSAPESHTRSLQTSQGQPLTHPSFLDNSLLYICYGVNLCVFDAQLYAGKEQRADLIRELRTTHALQSPEQAQKRQEMKEILSKQTHKSANHIS